MNSFFYDKVKKIIKGFKPVIWNPLIFLQYFIPKPKSRFNKPYISIEKFEEMNGKIKELVC